MPSQVRASRDAISATSARHREEARGQRLRTEPAPVERVPSKARPPGTDGSSAGAARNGARRVEFVQSLQRGFEVIRAFGPDRTHLSVTDVAQATGLTRAVARRFLLTLVELGYVRSEGRMFSLRPRILELGYAYLSGLTLPDVAQPFMEELSARVQESTSAAVLDGDEIVYVANVVPRRVMTINVPIGGRDPAYCTALGRVLLAARSDEDIDDYLGTVSLERCTDSTVTDPSELKGILRRVRSEGYALVDHELEDGLVAIAVPVHDTSGAVVAAMNVSAYSLRASPRVLEQEFLPPLKETVAAIEEEVRVAVQLRAAPQVRGDAPGTQAGERMARPPSRERRGRPPAAAGREPAGRTQSAVRPAPPRSAEPAR